jgi:hypothetical protein
LIPKEDRVQSRKLDPRAEIGILVSYEGEYIYRVWIPGFNSGRRGYGRIVRTSNVKFDEYSLIIDATTDGLAPQVDIHVPSESRGEHDNSDKLEVRREAPALDDNTLERYKTESPDNNEVLDADEAPGRPIKEEEEFFDLSDADAEEPPLASQPPPNPVVEDADEDEEAQTAQLKKRTRKVWE